MESIPSLVLAAVAALFPLAQSTPPGEGPPAPAPKIPGVAPEAEAVKEGEKPSETVGEITVNRPPLPLWRFESKSAGFGERILLAKPFPEGAAESPSSAFEDTWGIEALSLLGRYEAAVLVTTLDRGAHTNIGSQMVDPGSKAQLVDAHLALIQKHVKKTGKPKKNSNASLGGVAAAQLRVTVTADGGRSFDVTGYFVPMKAYTYTVWFLLPADAPKPLEKEVDEIRKAVKFGKASGS